MKTINEIKEIFKIEFEEKLYKNFTKRVYIHNKKSSMSKNSRIAYVTCHVTYKLDEDKMASQYIVGSRTEEFLMGVIDCYLDRLKTPDLTIEKKEVYRKFLKSEISLDDVINHQYT